jgi:hypothetical protein
VQLENTLYELSLVGPACCACAQQPLPLLDSQPSGKPFAPLMRLSGLGPVSLQTKAGLPTKPEDVPEPEVGGAGEGGDDV